jgi:heat shock protein HslJ
VDLPLEGTQWYLAGVAEGTSISLVFSGDSISGFSGCNNYNATYRSTRAAGSSNNISIGPISGGQAMCDEVVMNQEQNYLSSLASARSYRINGNTLSISTGISSLSFGAAQVAPRTE